MLIHLRDQYRSNEELSTGIEGLDCILRDGFVCFFVSPLWASWNELVKNMHMAIAKRISEYSGIKNHPDREGILVELERKVKRKVLGGDAACLILHG
jgi:hypothetical protein